jgi:hypothetical protein
VGWVAPWPLVYDELRQLAAHKLAQETPGQTLQATALVHEAYLRLVDVEKAQHWDSRGHFFAAAAEAMRRILIENVRRKRRGVSVIVGPAAIAASFWQEMAMPSARVLSGFRAAPPPPPNGSRTSYSATG